MPYDVGIYNKLQSKRSHLGVPLYEYILYGHSVASIVHFYLMLCCFEKHQANRFTILFRSSTFLITVEFHECGILLTVENV